jgi:hypothetical protein
MSFILDKENREKKIATGDISVFKPLGNYLNSLSFNYDYKVGESNPKVDLKVVVDGEIHEGYHSYRAPKPGFYRFIIPKGSEYYYTVNDSMQYVSESITLVSDKPLTTEECIKICRFPKTYEKACERLGVKPVNEKKLIRAGLSERDIAMKKLETVIECINRQYGIEEYDGDDFDQCKFCGNFVCGSCFKYIGPLCWRVKRDDLVSQFKGIRNNLPFEFAVEYVCNLNGDFKGLWKTYLGRN